MGELLVFVWMYIGCAVVAAHADVLSEKMISEIKSEKIELSRFSLGLNMAIYAVAWPLLLLLLLLFRPQGGDK